MNNKTDNFIHSLRKARSYFKKKQFEDACTMYLIAEKLAASLEERSIIWAELSWLYYDMRDFNNAIVAAEKVISVNTDYQDKVGLFRILGYSYLGLKDYLTAEHMLIQSLQQDSDSPEQQYVKYELGKLHFIQGQYDSAFPYFDEIKDFFKKTNIDYWHSICFYLGFIYYYLTNPDRAFQFFNQILSSQPKADYQAAAYYGLAYLEFGKKNYLEVISICEKILMIKEDFFDKESVGFLTATSYYYLGRYDIFNEFYFQMKKNYHNGRYQLELDKLFQTIAANKNN